MENQTNLKTSSMYVEINGISYFKFSGRIDKIHLYKNGALCGKPGLSSNYASEKPEEEYCSECLKKALESGEQKKVTWDDLLVFNKENIEDLITTAIEGGTNYWYWLSKETTKKVREYGDKNIPFAVKMIAAIDNGESLKIHDLEDRSNCLGEVNLKSIIEAEQLMKENHPEHFGDVIKENWDAITADMFFQLAVMRNVTFG